MNIKTFGIKVLKKLNLLKLINFNTSIYLNNTKIKIPFINGIGYTNYVLSENWIDSLLFNFIENDKSVIDVGVNIGQTLLRVKTLYPKVEYYGFEPNSTCNSYVQQLVKLNLFEKCNLQNCALSNSVANLILEKSYLEDSRASVIPSLRPNYFKNSENILSIDYQSFYLEKNISLVKIDVEGAEYDVLDGMKNALLKHKPIIICEVLDSHNNTTYKFTQDRATFVSNLMQSIDYGIVQLKTSYKKVISYNKIETIIVKQWTPESEFLNDFLFYPIEKEDSVFTKLNNIIA